MPYEECLHEEAYFTSYLSPDGYIEIFRIGEFDLDENFLVKGSTMIVATDTEGAMIDYLDERYNPICWPFIWEL